MEVQSRGSIVRIFTHNYDLDSPTGRIEVRLKVDGLNSENLSTKAKAMEKKEIAGLQRHQIGREIEPFRMGVGKIYQHH